ncbi:MAG: type III-A CRISPR-associated RAMP protein Csm5 [Nitrospirae bacterium]|nr:type III-A CRISPR-associated RAMP protein Csm5 [Nitrospirota bacterium]
MSRYKLKCEILSPLHIGSGESIDAMDYVINGGKLYGISFERFAVSLKDVKRTAFEELIDKGNLVEIRNYVALNFNPEKDALYAVDVSPQVEALYKTKLDDIRHQLLISPFIRTEGGTVSFVPGSSLKGALRTAVISEVAKKSGLKSPRDAREEYQFEAQVLRSRDPKDDPFRGLKIRDKALQPEETVVREVKNVSKKRGASQIPMICEVAHSTLTGRSVVFETEISLDDDLFNTGFLSRRFSMDDMIKACFSFYRNKMEMEHHKFYVGGPSEKISEKLLSTSLANDSFLLRLGRFSGVESVTLDNYRNPKPPGNKTVWGTSRNLAEGIYPMGWMKVAVSSTLG